jgi:GT2 family glycosyltransferase
MTAPPDRDERQDVIQQMSRQLAERQARLDELRRDVRYLSTAKGALRVLAGSALRAVGLYDLAYRHRGALKRLLGPLARPPAPVAVPAASTAARPTLLEAFVEARSLPGDMHDLALERLHHVGATLRRVLCVGSTPRVVQCAYMLASGGAQVALPGARLHPRLTASGIAGDERDLGTWLAAKDGHVVSGLDAVLIDASLGEDEKRLLVGRVPRDATVFVAGPGAADASPADEAPGLRRVPVPAAWIDPAPDAAYHAQRPWSGAPLRRAALPDRLPSGKPWPRITVVTVSLNHRAFLEQTLLSVLGQDYPDLEYIVVDGGSTDGSLEILERYRARLAFLVSEPDRGQSHALNKGFARATGQVLAWLNSDDRYPPGALFRAALALDTWDADVVAGGCGLVRDGGDAIERVHHATLPPGRAVPLPLERLLDVEGSWLQGDFFFQPEVFWTRAIWERCGARVDEALHYSMDYELWARFAAHGARVVHVPDLLALYRLHAGQKTDGVDPPYLPELRRLAAGLKASHQPASR